MNYKVFNTWKLNKFFSQKLSLNNLDSILINSNPLTTWLSITIYIHIPVFYFYILFTRCNPTCKITRPPNTLDGHTSSIHAIISSTYLVQTLFLFYISNTSRPVFLNVSRIDILLQIIRSILRFNFHKKTLVSFIYQKLLLYNY